MGRSVSYAKNSKHVEYAHIEFSDDYDHFGYFVDDLRDMLHESFPSVYPCDKWVGREDNAIAENRFANFGVSEYCGVVSLWVQPKNVDENLENLRDQWIEQIGKKFKTVVRKTTGTPLKKSCTASNGESLYQRI